METTNLQAVTSSTLDCVPLSLTSYAYAGNSGTGFSDARSDRFPNLEQSVGNLELAVEPSGALTNNLNFSKLYIFGDSLSDPGNIYNGTSFIQPFQDLFGLNIPVTPTSPPYFEGRYSNGPIWADYIAESLGLDVTPSTELSIFNPSLPFKSPVTITSDAVEVSPYFNRATTQQSVNFAFGGAQTGLTGSNAEFGELIPGLQQQVEWFIDDHKLANQSADPNALYIVWGGPNDYWRTVNPNPEQSVENIQTSLVRLYDIGARNFLVPNLPDLGQTPFAFKGGSEKSEQLTSLTLEHNTALDTTLNYLSDELIGVNIIDLDVYSLFKDAISNPEQYGFTNVTESFLDSSVLIPSANPDEYLFWDDVHPTGAAHKQLGEFALEALMQQSGYVSQPEYLTALAPEPMGMLTF